MKVKSFNDYLNKRIREDENPETLIVKRELSISSKDQLVVRVNTILDIMHDNLVDMGEKFEEETGMLLDLDCQTNCINRIKKVLLDLLDNQ